MTDDMAGDDPMEDPDRCTATASSTGERCKQPAIPGGSVCRFHGGSAPQVQEKAQKRLDRMADEKLADFEDRLDDFFGDWDDVDDPETRTVLMREMRQCMTDILDRAGNGPTETREVTGEDGGPVSIELNETVVETPHSAEDDP